MSLAALLLADASDVKKTAMMPKRKDWDHIGPASAKAHGLTGRAHAAEKDSKLGDPGTLHAAAAKAHRLAADKTAGADSERHAQAAEYHEGRAGKLGKREKRKRVTGPDHSLTGPRPDPKRDKAKCP
jgi:hypothetical protein